jgi:hypothetical protein
MAIGLVMTFDGVTEQHYDDVMVVLDLRSPGNPGGGQDWPAGIIDHYAGPTETGWCVVDVWESQERFDEFLSSRLLPAMEKSGVPQPNVTAFEVYGSLEAASA